MIDIRWGSKRRGGFTLVEVLIAMVLMSVLISISLNAFDEQIRHFTSGSTQLDATQNLRFTMSVFEKDVPTTGAGVPPEQPFLVYADTHVVALNADYMSNVPNDAFAIYVDTLQPTNMVNALTKPRRITLPGTAFQYPDTTYRVGASNSPAETIIFFFQRDASASRADTWTLWRQVNDQAPELMARNLLKPASGPFFRYQQRVTPTGGLEFTDSVPQAWLPLRHVRPIHGSPGDTGVFTRIDRVRGVDIAFRVTDAGPPGQERIFSTQRMISMPNAGKRLRRTCGDEPLLGGAFTFTAVAGTDAGGQPIVTLDWNQAVDELTGEADVVRYVLWKQEATPPGTSDPWISIPSGQAAYAYVDHEVVPGTTYYYALAAQDCTPTLSARRQVSVSVPTL